MDDNMKFVMGHVINLSNDVTTLNVKQEAVSLKLEQITKDHKELSDGLSDTDKSITDIKVALDRYNQNHESEKRIKKEIQIEKKEKQAKWPTWIKIAVGILATLIALLGLLIQLGII